MTAFTDLIARHVPGHGWLPLLASEKDGRSVELYRGEFKQSIGEAIDAAGAALDRIKAEGMQ